MEQTFSLSGIWCMVYGVWQGQEQYSVWGMSDDVTYLQDDSRGFFLLSFLLSYIYLKVAPSYPPSSLLPSLTHSITTSLTHSHIRPLTHSLAHSLTHSLTYSHTRPLTHSHLLSLMLSSSYCTLYSVLEYDNEWPSIHSHQSIHGL